MLCCDYQASEYKIPIYITETGIADKADGNRSHMIDEYMRAVSDRPAVLVCIVPWVAV